MKVKHMPIEFSIKYDRSGDALYIKLNDDDAAESDEIAPGIIADFNEKGEVIGVEILWFSKRKLDFTKLIIEGPEALVAKA